MPSQEFGQMVDRTTIAHKSRWIVVFDPDDQVLLTKPAYRFSWRLPSFEWTEEDSTRSIVANMGKIARTEVQFDRRVGFFLDSPIGFVVEVLSFRTDVRYLSNHLGLEWRWWSPKELSGRTPLVHMDSLFWIKSAMRREISEVEAVRPNKIIPFR